MESKYILNDYINVISDELDLEMLEKVSKEPFFEHKCLSFAFNEDEQQAIEHVEKIIKTYLPSFNLSIFYNNILDLMFKKRYTKEERRTASYFLQSNEIIIYHKKFSKFHELLHMATSPDGKRCGFYLDGIGVGMNEAYTTFLDNIYFNKNIKINSNLYQLLSEYALLTDLLIGRNEMVSCYSNASLYDLIVILSKYMDEKYVIMFINALDNIYNNYYNRIQCLARRTIQKNINYCTAFILCALDSKYSETKEYDDVMGFTIKLLSRSVNSKGYKYDKIDIEDEFVKAILNKMVSKKVKLKK